MPGPIKRDEPKRPRAGPSLITRPGKTETAEIPDPSPYQSNRDLRIPVDGSTVVVTETYWTRRGLMRWLQQCPKVAVQIPLDVANEGDDPEKVRPWEVYYDGFRFDVPRGQLVEVPAPIALIVQQSQQKYRTSQSRGLDLLTITPNNPHGMYIDIDGEGPPGELVEAEEEGAS